MQLVKMKTPPYGGGVLLRGVLVFDLGGDLGVGLDALPQIPAS